MKMAKIQQINYKQIKENFGTEEKCIHYLEKLRWGDTPTCTRCGSADVKRPKTKKLEWYCKDCQKNFNVKLGTMFQATKISLQDWFFIAMYMILIKKGVSVRSIARMVGINKNTGIRITHIIRERMEKDMLFEKLKGTVEADEAYIGGLSKWRKRRFDENGVLMPWKRGIGTAHQVCVWGSVQREERDSEGNITQHKRARVVVHFSKDLRFKELYKLVDSHIDVQKSKLMTDGLRGYRWFGRKGIMEHKYTLHNAGWYVDPNDYNTHSNNIESLWRCIKSNINGCRHKVSAKHLQKYLAEQVFRFNYKDFGSRFAFDKILELGVVC